MRRYVAVFVASLMMAAGLVAGGGGAAHALTPFGDGCTGQGPNDLDCALEVGAAHLITHVWFDPNGFHEDLPGYPGVGFGVGPTACGNPLNITVLGTDNNIWINWYGGGWHSWASLGNPGVGLTTQACVEERSGVLDVYAGGANGWVYERFLTFIGWTNWAPVFQA